MIDSYDVVIVGAGPAGLSAALALGRACRSVLLCDDGPRRNARAHAVQNFVTRDGTPPSEFRRVAHEQMKEYPSVEFLAASVTSIVPHESGLHVQTAARQVSARRVLLCTGLVDEPMDIAGFEQLWGTSIFQCPYCHGWERRNQRWGYLAPSPETIDFPLVLRQWTSQVTLFTQGLFVPADEKVNRLRERGVTIETRPIVELVCKVRDGEPHLEAVRFGDGQQIPCESLFAHPKQKAVDLIESLGVARDDYGFVMIDPMTRQTSMPRVYAAGDVTTRLQAAIVAAASGTQAAAAINHNLAVE